jgi:hypothetical protein
LDSIRFFQADNDNIFDNNKIFAQYEHETIFRQIKELYEKTTKKKTKQGALAKLFGAKTVLNTIQNEIPNSYTGMLEAFLNQRVEEEKKQKEIEKEFQDLLSLFESEQHKEVLKIINSNQIMREKLFNSKNKKVILHEEKMLEFFDREVNNITGFTKMNNKFFDLSYKVTEKNQLIMKFEKELDINFINFLSLIYETGMYTKWFPFCSHSEVLHQPGKAKKVIYMSSSVPLISDRDFLVYGFGVSRIKENRTIVLCVQSIDEDSGVFEECVQKKKNKKMVRASIHIFAYEIKIINRNKIYLKGLMNVDPKISFIPQSLINMVTKKFAEDLFNKMIKIGSKYEGSEYQNKNPSEIDQQFYNFINEQAKNLEDY